jgi:mannose-6-phosphate isomerase
MDKEQTLFRLTGQVQHYDWGGYNFIPDLLGISNVSHKPFAEYWLGSHPLLPSYFLHNDEPVPLHQAASLPYLLKLLDVRDMLSIQVHPSKKAAEIEFARENNEKIPLNAPNRNYRDDNHKPELALALDDFRLLHGFKKKDELVKIMKAVPEFDGLLAVLLQHGYEELYKTVMGMPQEKINEILQPLLQRIIPVYKKGSSQSNEEDYWAAKAALKFNREGNIDRGIFSIYFFNLVCLKKGEAIFQPAGVPHAYLEGQCVEIMSNSDNVLRGGLTTKHVDVKELMKHIKCEPLEPVIIKGKMNSTERVYETQAPDFQLSCIALPAGGKAEINPLTTEIILVLRGNAELSSGDMLVRLKQGQSAVVFVGQKLVIKAIEQTELYRASVPVHRGE